MAVTSTGKGRRRQIQAALDSIKGKEVAVGVFDSAHYPDVTPVAYVAAIQEFGYPGGNIPARPFMRPTIEAQRNAWRATLLKGMKAVINEQITAQNMLEQFGMSAAAQVKVTITQIHKPELRPATIQARRNRRSSPGVSIKPLVDTGTLLNSIESTVRDV